MKTVFLAHAEKPETAFAMVQIKLSCLEGIMHMPHRPRGDLVLIGHAKRPRSSDLCPIQFSD